MEGHSSPTGHTTVVLQKVDQVHLNLSQSCLVHPVIPCESMNRRLCSSPTNVPQGATPLKCCQGCHHHPRIECACMPSEIAFLDNPQAVPMAAQSHLFPLKLTKRVSVLQNPFVRSVYSKIQHVWTVLFFTVHRMQAKGKQNNFLGSMED